MKRFLVLVHDQSDVSVLADAAQALIAGGTQKIWLLHSPAVVIDQATAAEKFDGEIAGLQEAENAAARRGDYEAAKEYKTKREANILERGKALRDAWRQIPQEERKKRVMEISDSFRTAVESAGRAMTMQVHGDHYDRTELPGLLNSLSALLPPGFTFGNFIIATAADIAAGAVERASAPKQKSEPKKEHVDTFDPQNRFEKLKSMRFLSLKKEAKLAGVELKEGMKMKDIIFAILEKEKLANAA